MHAKLVPASTGPAGSGTCRSLCLRLEPAACVAGAWRTVFGLVWATAVWGAGARSDVGATWLERAFAAEVAGIEETCWRGVDSKAAWEGKREGYRRELADMLGLWPMPERGDLKATVTGRVEDPEFTVEKLHFQSMPGLYVTANLYVPQGLKQPAPAILYVCGHALVKTNGVSCGNKTAYQHHGIWLAQHGYVALLIDTVQLGEIEGLHHGTHREGMWWWNARGYTPAGVETWNSIRALDYLETRPEVDRTRLGMTGRSGGGSYSWTTAALDERVRVVAPVAGITDLRNQVVDGCIEGHCDCMFFLNTRRWDFARVAALMAPRPLLIVNTDADSIFPLDGVVRIHAQVQRVYGVLGKEANLGLVIGPGGHQDTQDLQVPVLRWFNRHLKGEEVLIERPARKRFDPLALRVFDQLPADQINTRIHETFGGPMPEGGAAAGSAVGGGSSMAFRERLEQRVFRAWPAGPGAPALKEALEVREGGLSLTVLSYASQPEVRPWLLVIEKAGGRRRGPTELVVLDEAGWGRWRGESQRVFGTALERDSRWLELTAKGTPGVETPLGTGGAPPAWLERVRRGEVRYVGLVPRGVGPAGWVAEAKKEVQIRRRFMLLGQTLAGMQVWDIRQGIQALQRWDRKAGEGWTVVANGEMGVNALYACLWETGVVRLRLTGLPRTHRDGPDYPGVLKEGDIEDAVRGVRARGIEVDADPVPSLRGR